MLATVAQQAQDTQDTLAIPSVDAVALLPQLILMVGGLLLLTIVSLVKGRMPKSATTLYTVAIASASLISTIPLWHRVQNPAEGPTSLMAGAVGLDGFSLFVTWVICIGVALAALLGDGYLRREGLDGPEFYVLLLLSAAGGVTMASANDLIVMFIGLEALSLAAYVLAAMHARRIASQEAGMKYFVLGAFASAFLLYGIALTYGATGSTNLAKIQQFLSDSVLTQDGMLLAGLALMLVGFGFKVAAVPFHSWTPDVYEGSPSPTTAFMASVVKAAAFAGLIRVFVVTFPSYAVQWRPAVYALAAASLVVGAVLAVVQSNVKRMLAYSSINHAGFILLGVQAATATGTSAALFYLLAYTFMVVGSFGVVSLVGRGGGPDRHHLSSYRGLAKRQPVLALAFTLFLLASAGAPFTAGFLAKFGVIGAVVERENWSLAAIAMLSAVISTYLYLRIVGTMYFSGDEDDALERPKVRVNPAARVALTVAVAGTLALGIIPGPFADLAQDAVAQLVAAP
ncbi:MAG TPA: NADH-quinone oxidoreductase subunit N [Microthrixaceae bacterium]|nr:NADH-quinone oxidoreductase subunit N [Microthrixaceae bacterium]